MAVSERGVAKAEKFLGVDNLYLAEHGSLVNHLHQALKVEAMYKQDMDYAVIDGEVMIIDEFTGRILEGGAGRRACTRPSRRRRGWRSTRSADARDDHLPELLRVLRQARAA